MTVSTASALATWRDQAQEYLDDGRWAQAIEFLLEQLQESPANAQALVLLGDCYLAGGAAESAQVCYAGADAMSPGLAGPRMRLARETALGALEPWLINAEFITTADDIQAQLDGGAVGLRGAVESMVEPPVAVPEPPAPSAPAEPPTEAASSVDEPQPALRLAEAEIHRLDEDLYHEFRAEFQAVESESTATAQITTKEKRKHGQRVRRFLGSIGRSYSTYDLLRYALWAVALLFISATLLSIVEYDTFYASVAEDMGRENPTWLDTYFHTLWWSVVTFTTVGYGDISPVTHFGKFLSILSMLANFAVVTVLGGAVASVLVAARLEGGKILREDKFIGHTIICGWSALVPVLLKVLDSDPDANPVIILINETDEDKVNRSIAGCSRLDISQLQENFTQEAVLQKAFLAQAGRMIVVPDHSGLLPNQSPDEQKTILATLTAKHLAEDVRVIAHVLEAEHISHLHRANVDEIVLADAQTPELLAHHVINPGLPQLVEQLISGQSQNSRLQVVNIPPELMGALHRRIFAYFKITFGWLLLGYAIKSAGFSLEEEMGESGTPYIRAMITEQLETAGVTLTSDERIVVEVNPDDAYVVDEKHRAVVLR